MNGQSLTALLSIAIFTASCTPGAKKHEDVAVDASAAERVGALTAELADASAQLSAAKDEFAATYAKARTETQEALKALDAKAATLKMKAGKLIGQKKTKADAAVALYDKRSAATAAAVASLPATEPDASAADSSIAALLPLFQATRDAYDALYRAVDGT